MAIVYSHVRSELRPSNRGACLFYGGPYGWRSVVVTAAGGELGFWQPKR